MTVIAARQVGSIVQIAADSLVARGNFLSPNANIPRVKLVQQNGFVWGASGGMFESSLMEVFGRGHKPVAPTVEAVADYLLEFREWARKKEPNFVSENFYLFVVDGVIIESTGGISSHICGEYGAIGAGAEYAIAALYLGKTAEESCRVACNLSPWCMEPVQTIEVAVP